MKKLFYFLSIMLLAASCKQSGTTAEPGSKNLELSETDTQEITNTFMQTKDSWNMGDLEGFMSAYWNSEDLLFVGSRGPTYGYAATLANYQKGYPNVQAMGQLEYEVIDLYQIDTHTAFMVGKFILTRDEVEESGYYTLVWQKINDKWLIISDHSSLASPAAKQ
jgi:hypothetical protein